MNTIGWFLVFMGGLQHMGPFNEKACKRAATELVVAGVTCMQPKHAYACSLDGRPGTSTVCYKFDVPEITLK